MKDKKNYSKEFKDFILALQAWIDNGCFEPDYHGAAMGFRNNDSICFQIRRWTKNEDTLVTIESDLKYALEEFVGSAGFPFNRVDNDGASKSYEIEVSNRTHYQNPERLAWIKMMADTFKAEENK